jgi:hypothetical protein
VRYLGQLLAVIATVISTGSLAAELSPAAMDAVVALGITRNTPSIDNPVVHPEWFTEGTGFFYGHLTKDDPDPAKRLYTTYLVTRYTGTFGL